MPETQSRTTSEGGTSRITVPILIAGLLGGLLGGVVSFAASRFIKPTEPAPPAHVPSPKEEATAEAQQIVEKYLAIIKQGPMHNEEFMKAVKSAYTNLDGNDFTVFKQGFDDGRIKYEGWYGKSSLVFELLHVNALNPNLVEFVYLEKFEHGSLNWRFIMYRGEQRWFIAWLSWSHIVHDAFLP
jgi:hypothetical protein